jgi:Mg2+/Co2+ transporter CorB
MPNSSVRWTSASLSEPKRPESEMVVRRLATSLVASSADFAASSTSATDRSRKTLEQQRSGLRRLDHVEEIVKKSDELARVDRP